MTSEDLAGSDRSHRPFVEPFQALKNQTFRWYWTSGFGATGALGLQQFALAWLVLDLTDSVGQLGLVIFLQGVPLTLGALFGGVLADRYDRRNLLIYSQAFTAANLALLSALILTDLIQIWVVYVSALGLGSMQALIVPARQALVRSLVKPDEMLNAVALNTVQVHTSRIIWPASAGVLVAVAGVGTTFAVSALCAALGIACLFRVKGASHATIARGTSFVVDVKDGIHYTFSTPVVSTIMKLGLGIAILGLGFQALAPGFAREEMGFSSAQTGVFMMSAGVGAMVGSVLFLVVNVHNKMRAFILLTAAFGISLSLIAINPFAPASFPLMAVYGFSNATAAVAGLSLLQTTALQQYMGRVMSLFAAGVGFGFLLALPIGLIGDLIGLRWPVFIFSAAFAVWTLWTARPSSLAMIERSRAVVAQAKGLT